MNGVRFIAVVLVGCAASAKPAHVTAPIEHPPIELARFMREQVNVPFSFAMLETDTRGSTTERVYAAARVLRDAAAHLAHWSHPPRVSVQGREVFFTYARYLESQVRELEHASRELDSSGAAASLAGIRRTCNSCHRFFRPAARLSHDVLYDRFAVELGEVP